MLSNLLTKQILDESNLELSKPENLERWHRNSESKGRQCRGTIIIKTQGNTTIGSPGWRSVPTPTWRLVPTPKNNLGGPLLLPTCISWCQGPIFKVVLSNQCNSPSNSTNSIIWTPSKLLLMQTTMKSRR